MTVFLLSLLYFLKYISINLIFQITYNEETKEDKTFSSETKQKIRRQDKEMRNKLMEYYNKLFGFLTE